MEALAARLGKGLGKQPVRFLGQGWDAQVYAVGQDHVIRLAKESDATVRRARTAHEVAVLDVAARYSTVPVPGVVAVDLEEGALLCTRVPGIPAGQGVGYRPALVGRQLGELVTALHAAPASVAGVVGGPHTSAAQRWEEAVTGFARTARQVSPGLRDLVRSFLAEPALPDVTAAVFCHNDIRGDHVMIDPATGGLAGLIDWGDAVWGDPARDFATVLVDFGDSAYDHFVSAYGGAIDETLWQRVNVMAALRMVEDLAFRVTVGDDAGQAHTESVLADLLGD